MRGERFWWWWVAAGSLATAAYFLLPDEGLVSNLVYDAIGLVSTVMIIVGVRLHRAGRRAMWYWFAAGQLTWVLGDLVWEYYKYVLDQEPYPSPADVLYLSAYPFFVAGMIMLMRGRGARDRDLAALIDASIVAIGLGLVFWVFVMHPIAADSTASTLERVIGVAYPAADALLLAMLARFYTGVVRRSTSIRLLGAAAVLLLVADVCYSLISLYSDVNARFLDAGWLLSYVCWGAAALHPSMRVAGTARRQARDARVGRARLLLLAVCSLLAPGLLFLPGSGDHVDRLVIAAGAVLLFLLVVVRMSGFVGQVQRQADQLEDLAMADDLTGLANRRRFERDLRTALAAGRTQVALLDLDDFKGVNDRLGHGVGDRLLTVAGQRLRAALPPEVLVARMGGDEFAVLLPGATGAEADRAVARLADALREPIVAGDHELLVSASIGVADGAGTADPYEVLRRADVAMYAAKAAAADRPRRYAADLDEQSDEQARVGAELRTALDTGQFRVVYQPIVALPSGRPVAVEALVRWAHPERGTVPPDHFIPAAERNGLIVELGEWILRTACAQAMEWQAAYGDLAPARMSVNVSARQLAEPGFAALVAAVLDETGLPAGRLTVEVTETAVFGGGQAVQSVQDLHDLGVHIALDDFGTGHSSLGLLQTVPVDVLKVDKSFVDSITMAGRHAVIATALIQVSAGLGLTAVAEGVETAEQAAELHRLGYELAQGYHFGRPSPEPSFLTPGPSPAAAVHVQSR
ncbi:putative bifunctional diguanylate cyclase/phosphodiesterase [Pseudosporangium ferrugineum]|uniref:Diguanylate cyclase (GGDEF)-like protein n=1 Tax=Pseudosporangium ferrugineum TaxID=439699 RepID=A0A2T0SJH0_9ACTN|nr:bifunctional diguanylate cyclase/phosphodiesterase [Pseudosporangium ferrugineum]PRY33545.1 diguanylate cyclase (GGDEF)-like protein [Pseudosporangium ferrugineum]